MTDCYIKAIDLASPTHPSDSFAKWTNGKISFLLVFALTAQERLTCYKNVIL